MRSSIWDLGSRVDGRRVRSRVAVYGRVLLDDPVDVRHRYEDLDRPIAKRFGDRELIEIPRVVIVDRGPEQVAEVAKAGLGCSRVPRDRRCLRPDFGREVRNQAVLEHGAPRDARQEALAGRIRMTQ